MKKKQKSRESDSWQEDPQEIRLGRDIPDKKYAPMDEYYLYNEAKKTENLMKEVGRKDEDLRLGVIEAIYLHRDLDTTGMKIFVDQGNVTFKGSVKTAADKDLVEAIAMQVSGVHEVLNLLRVEDSSSVLLKKSRDEGSMTKNV